MGRASRRPAAPREHQPAPAARAIGDWGLFLIVLLVGILAFGWFAVEYTSFGDTRLGTQIKCNLLSDEGACLLLEVFR